MLGPRIPTRHDVMPGRADADLFDAARFGANGIKNDPVENRIKAQAACDHIP